MRFFLVLFIALAVVPVTLLFAGEDEASSPKPAIDADRVLWSLDLASDSKGSGHVADIDGDGKLEIVFGTYFGDEHVYAVNAEDGSVLWKHASEGGPFDASIAIADLDGDDEVEILAADSASGRFYCLDGKGTEKWTMKLPSGTDSPPAIGDLDGDGKPEIVVGTMWRRGGAGCVCAIDPRTQEFLWQADVKGCVQSEPALVDLDEDGTLDVIVTSWRGDRGVHAFDGEDGASLWTHTTEGDEKSMGMYHGVSVATTRKGLRLVVPTCNGDVYALDRKGAVVWHRKFIVEPGKRNDYIFSPSTLADCDGNGRDDVIVGGRMLRALSVKDGHTLWERQVPGGFVARGVAPVDLDADGKIEIVFNSGTKALVVEGATGKDRLVFEAAIDATDRHEKISAAPLIADFDGDGKPDLFVVCGRGYSGDMEKDNRARALGLRLGPGRGAWRTFRGNLRRTGSVTPPAR